MIEAMTLQQVQQITGGRLAGGTARFSAVSTDTRTLQAGELFVALQGPNFDGNAFVAAAQQKGACAAIVARPVDVQLPTLQVPDARIALGQLGATNRERSRARVLGLTGSQGKTTVKEMTAAILARLGPVLSTRGNLNNDYGVPLTLLKLDAGHDYAVVEMGANAAGEIAYVTALARPDIALITNIAPTHLEGFGDIAGVARGKAELWAGLPVGGTAILNIDDAQIPTWFRRGDEVRSVTISASGNAAAAYALETWHEKGLAGSEFVLRTPQGRVEIRLALPGLHNAGNALAASALAMEAGATPAQVSAALAGMQAVKGRLSVRRGRQGSVIIDDTYNASPASFRAAIDVLARRGGLRIVVAGDMGELGSEQERAHAELGAYAREQGIEHFFATGELSRLAVAAYGSGSHADDCEALAAAVLPLLGPHTSVLVKGSRSARMERVVAQLVEQED